MNDLAAIVERDAASGSIAPSITTAGTHDAYAPADRRALLALLRETREALHRLSLPDEMNGMGDVDDMPPGPGRGELESRMSFARYAAARLAALGETR